MKLFAAALSLCPVLAAQATLHVGPGQPYSDLPGAIAAASPGDRLLVHTGTYSPFVLDRGVVVRAEPPTATVDVAGVYGSVVLITVPAGQTAVLEGLTIAHRVDVQPGTSTAGVLSMTEVQLTGGMQVTDAHVVMRDCMVDGGGIGSANFAIWAVRLFGAANLSAVQSAFRGGNGWFLGASGISADQQSQLHLSGCTVTGGYGASVHQVAAIGSGVVLTGAAKGWFVDSTLEARPYPGVPGFVTYGVDNQSSEPAVLERCVTRDHQLVSPSTSGNVQNGFVLGVATSTPLARGATFQLDFASRPGFPVVVHGTLQLAAPIAIPVLAQRDFGFATNSLLLSFGVADPAGMSSYALPIPNLAGLLDLPVWFTAWSGDSFPVQLAPTAGGLIR